MSVYQYQKFNAFGAKLPVYANNPGNNNMTPLFYKQLCNKWLYPNWLISFAALAILLFAGLNHSIASATTLQNITFSSLAGDKVLIKLSFSGPATEPGSFTISNPARIALDFPNTSSSLGWKSKNIGIGFAKSVTAVAAGNRTRVIINLVQLLPFETRTEGRNVYITLAGGRTASPTGKSSIIAPTTASTVVPGDNTIHNITNIDFRRGQKGEGRVVITLSDENTPISTGESANLIFVDFGNTGLPNSLQQRLDVIDFATPVQFIDATRSGNRVRLSITPAGRYEYLAYHSGKTFTLEVKPLVATKEEKEKEQLGQEYTGEKLSLSFQNIDVRAVLQLIADFTNLNLVTSDSVKGSITLRLKNVPWDQALDIILKTKGLGMRKSGNVILVAPSKEITDREKLELQAKKQIEQLEPLKTELIQVNYAKATDLAALLTAKGTGVMSDRGKTAIDVRTNTIIAVDTVERLLAVRKLVAKLDKPVKQVMIEARIVIANNTFARDLGVKFGVTSVSNKKSLITTSGSLQGTDVTVAAGSSGLPISTTTSTVPVGSLNNRLNVNLPAAAANAGRIALAILSGNILLDLELSALQTEGRGEIISNPRVITADQQEALIQQGTEIPYQEATSSGATSVSFKEAVLSMRVTPRITPDDRIMLELTVSKDDLSGTIVLGVPAIDTKKIKTQVLVNNGDTVVLGGIYEQRKIDSVSRVPFLGDLPFIGALFRNTNNQDDKSELLIFITPKILKDDFNTTQ